MATPTLIATLANGLIRLDHRGSGSESGASARTLWLSAESLPWLIEQLSAVLADSHHPDVRAQHGLDDVELFIRGLAVEPMLFIHNRRAANASQAGLSGLRLSHTDTLCALQQLKQLVEVHPDLLSVSPVS